MCFSQGDWKCRGNTQHNPMSRVEAAKFSIEHHLGLSVTAERNEGNVNSSWEILWCFLAALILRAFLGSPSAVV